MPHSLILAMHPQPHKTILVVDDQPTARLLLKQFLKSDGYETVEAASGEEAVRLAEETDFAGILLDYKMSGIDGIETCRRIRAIIKHKVTPILIITVADEDAVLNEAFAAGCDDYIVKPINNIVLHARLTSHIDRTELYYQHGRAVCRYGAIPAAGEARSLCVIYGHTWFYPALTAYRT